MLEKIIIEETIYPILQLPNRPKALLDRHVAQIYQMPTKQINQAVRRNPEKFPDDFCFLLTLEEAKSLSEVTNCDLDWNGGYLPRAFTWEGCNMLATILKSDVAITRAIQIIRIFTAVEKGLAKPQPTLQFLQAEQKAALELAHGFGLQGNQASLFANQIIRDKYQIDLLTFGGFPALTSETQEPEYNATTLGKDLLGGISPQKVNKLLERAGLIRSYRDNKDRLQWDLTDEGKPYGVWKDTAKKHGSGTPVKQLLYKKSIVDVLKEKKLI